MANRFLMLMSEILRTMKETQHPKNLMTVSDLARYTGWSESRIYYLTSQRLIPHSKPVGKTIFFKRSEIDRWIFRDPIKPIEELEHEYNRRRR